LVSESRVAREANTKKGGGVKRFLRILENKKRVTGQCVGAGGKGT